METLQGDWWNGTGYPVPPVGFSGTVVPSRPSLFPGSVSRLVRPHREEWDTLFVPFAVFFGREEGG